MGLEDSPFRPRSLPNIEGVSIQGPLLLRKLSRRRTLWRASAVHCHRVRPLAPLVEDSQDDVRQTLAGSDRRRDSPASHVRGTQR